MEMDDFINQFLKIREKETERMVWEVWLTKLPNMTQDNYLSYDEMLNIVKQQEVKQDIPINGVYIDQCFF